MPYGPRIPIGESKANVKIKTNAGCLKTHQWGTYAKLTAYIQKNHKTYLDWSQSHAALKFK